MERVQYSQDFFRILICISGIGLFLSYRGMSGFLCSGARAPLHLLIFGCISSRRAIILSPLQKSLEKGEDNNSVPLSPCPSDKRVTNGETPKIKKIPTGRQGGHIVK